MNFKVCAKTKKHYKEKNNTKKELIKVLAIYKKL